MKITFSNDAEQDGGADAMAEKMRGWVVEQRVLHTLNGYEADALRHLIGYGVTVYGKNGEATSGKLVDVTTDDIVIEQQPVTLKLDGVKVVHYS